MSGHIEELAELVRERIVKQQTTVARAFYFWTLLRSPDTADAVRKVLAKRGFWPGMPAERPPTEDERPPASTMTPPHVTARSPWRAP